MKSFPANRAHQSMDIRRSLPRVYCRFCGKAIRLSTTFITREAANKQSEQTSAQELGSRLFSASCQSCHEEAFYTLSQILDIPDKDPGT
jgi:cytochrome c5